MSDCRAEGEIYRAVHAAVIDLRYELLGGWTGRFPHELVGRVNELIEDLGWRLQLARYAEPKPVTGEVSVESAGRLWSIVGDLREALRGQNVGHRGWSVAIDGDVGYALTGTGYELVQFRRQW